MNGSYISPVNYNSKQNTPEWGCERASNATLSMNTAAVYFCGCVALFVCKHSVRVIVQRRRSARTKTNALMECLLPNYLTRARSGVENTVAGFVKEKGVGANEWSARSKLLLLDQKSDWMNCFGEKGYARLQRQLRRCSAFNLLFWRTDFKT